MKKSLISAAVLALALVAGFFALNRAGACYWFVYDDVNGSYPACAKKPVAPPTPDATKKMVENEQNECNWEDQGTVSLGLGQVIRIKNACGTAQKVKVTQTVGTDWNFTVNAGTSYDIKCTRQTTMNLYMMTSFSNFAVECE